MLYQKSWLIAAIWLMVMTAAGCGGSSDSPLSAAPGSNDGNGTGQSFSGDNPLVRQALSYDQAAYPAVEGFRVVPLVDDFSALGAQQSPYEFTVKVEDDEAVVTISAEDARQVLLHVRYSADEWLAESVTLNNPWEGAEDSFSANREFAPGALVISSVPAGDPGMFKANGRVAEVRFRRGLLDARQVSSRFPPCPNLNQMNILWYCTYSSQEGYKKEATGTFTYAMDGEPGVAASKDGQLTSTEASTPVAANLAQDAVLTPHGSIIADIGSTNLELSFTERLTADHDNNGVVTMGDLTAIGQCATVTKETFYSKFTALENLSPIKLHELMTTHNVQNPWYETSRDVVAFYNSLSTTNSPAGFTVDTDRNRRDTSLDSFWDGFIRDYDNTKDLNAQNVVDWPTLARSVYMNGSWHYHPGDGGTIGYSYLTYPDPDSQWIYGYEVWTLPTASAFDIASPPNRLSPPAGYTRAATYLRQDTVHSAPAGFAEYSDYPDKPWLLPGTERYCRAQFDINLNAGCFPANAGDIGNGVFDVVVVPFSFTDESSASSLAYGPATRISNAVTFLPEVPPSLPDHYGPQYHEAGAQTPPNDRSHALYELGMNSVVQPNYNQLVMEYWDADDVDENGDWSANGEKVYYKVYAMSHPPGSQDPPPTPAELFVPGNIRTGLSFRESEGTDNGLRTKVFEFADNEWEYSRINLPLRTPGSTIWFGIRAFDRSVGGYAEYAHDGTPAWPANERIVTLAVMDFEAPYYIRTTDEYSSVTPAANDFLSSISVYDGGVLWIKFYPAIDPPTYSAADDIRYELFVDQAEFDAEDTLLMQPEMSVDLAYEDHYDANSGLDQDAYSFVYSVIAEDTKYYYYVRATAINAPAMPDAQYNQPLPVRDFTWEPQEPGEAVVPPGQDFGLGAGVCPGAIKIVDDDIHVAYVTATDYPDSTRLVYSRYDDRDITTLSHSDIAVPETVTYKAGGARSSVDLGFKLNSATGGLQYDNGKPLPVISYCGSQNGITSMSNRLYTVEAVPNGLPDDWNWNAIHHAELSDSNPLTFTSNASTISYSYFDSQGQSSAMYLLAWSNDEDWSGNIANGENKYKCRDAASYWDLNSGFGSLLHGGEYLCWATYAICCDLEYNAVASPGWTSNWPTSGMVGLAQQAEDPYHNILYLLTGSSTSYEPEWHEFMLWRMLTLMPTTFVGENMLDVIKGNAEWDRSGASYGPISHCVVATNDKFSEADVYVGFCNAVIGTPDTDDDTGLRILYSHDSGSLPSVWSSPGSLSSGLGIIDKDFYMASSDSIPTTKVFDIAKKHAAESNPQPFSGLGCVYVDNVTGELLLAETVNNGGSLEWQRVTIASRDHVEQGAINWACLAYDSLDVPYILYSISEIQTISHTGHVYLWKRP